MTNDLLGQRLLREGIINHQQLDKALFLQKEGGGKIGEILQAMGACNSLTLHQQLAAQQSLPFADLLKYPPDSSLLSETELESYLSLQAIPWQRLTETDEVIIAACYITDTLRLWANQHFPQHRFALTSRLDIHRSLSLLFVDAFNRLSREKLQFIAPEQSAYKTLQRRQQLWLGGVGLLLLAGFIAAPIQSLVWGLIAINIFYLATLFFKTILFLSGIHYQQRLERFTGHSFDSPDISLPLYSILIPLYKEADCLPQLVKHIRALDYPKDKLDVKLVMEADDTATIAIAKSMQLEGFFEIIIVPPSLPRTKPKACNYALRFVRGEFVTIYDAEDKPDRQQLRRVLHRFRSASRDVVCVQCRLNYYNREHNLLTRLFAIEYAAWFNYMLPGLESLGLPIPLGGTSNHIALARLMELGEWDPYNVTEDADLGIRMAVARYRTVTLDSVTLEEAPITLIAWIKQRSRWIKGYMQTWLVHMRRPVRLYQRLGAAGFWGFQFFIGGPCFIFLSTPLLLLISFSWMAGWITISHSLSHTIGWLSLLAFSYGVIMHLAIARHIITDIRWPRMRIATAVFPFYWLLHSLASFRGLWQLATRPHYWDKTTHGFTPAGYYHSAQTLSYHHSTLGSGE